MPEQHARAGEIVVERDQLGHGQPLARPGGIANGEGDDARVSAADRDMLVGPARQYLDVGELREEARERTGHPSDSDLGLRSQRRHVPQIMQRRKPAEQAPGMGQGPHVRVPAIREVETLGRHQPGDHVFRKPASGEHERSRGGRGTEKSGPGDHERPAPPQMIRDPFRSQPHLRRIQHHPRRGRTAKGRDRAGPIAERPVDKGLRGRALRLAVKCLEQLDIGPEMAIGAAQRDLHDLHPLLDRRLCPGLRTIQKASPHRGGEQIRVHAGGRQDRRYRLRSRLEG